MYITDNNRNIIQEINTSFDVCYRSLFTNHISLDKLLDLKKNDGVQLIDFHSEINSEVLSFDSTCLFYIALLKNFPNQYPDLREEALHFISQYGKREHKGFVSNLLIVWILNILGLKSISLENKLLNCLSSNMLVDDCYHNKSFILFTSKKAVNDFMDSDFKTSFNDLLNENLKDNCVPASFDRLIYPDGIFKVTGKDCFVHLFRPVMLDTRRDRFDTCALSGSGFKYSGAI